MTELKKAGTAVAAVCKPKSKIESYLASREIPYSHLPSYSPSSLQSVRFLRMLVDRQGADVVHTHYHRDIWPASFALSREAATKLFLSVYMGVGSKRDPWHRYIYRRVNGFFAPSDSLLHRLREAYPIPPERVHLLPYGRNLDLFVRSLEKREAIRAKLGIGPAQMLVGTMIRIDPGKGVLDFVQSYQHLDDRAKSHVRYLVVGEPTRRGNVPPNESPFEPHCVDYLENIKSYIDRNALGGKIELVGFQEDVVGYLSALDVFVFPSRDEMYSIAMLEAMAMSLPVVAAGASGNLEQIESGVNGLLYEPANASDLAARIMEYAAHPEVGSRHGAAARKFVEDRHDMKKCVHQLLEFYATL